MTPAQNQVIGKASEIRGVAVRLLGGRRVSAFEQMMRLSDFLPQLSCYHVVVPNLYMNPRFVIVRDPANGLTLSSIDLAKDNPTHTYSWFRTPSDEYLLTVKDGKEAILFKEVKIKIFAGQTLRIVFKADGSSKVRVLGSLTL